MCGEPCSLQLCRDCSSAEKLDSIADFIMQRKLRELDASSSDLDERTITIPACNHTFTVATLDGICELSEYYSKDLQGKWNGLVTPNPGFRKSPSCPSCRQTIKAPRYSRVFKNADLGIIERNVSISSSRDLERVRASFSNFNTSLAQAALSKGLESISMSPLENPDEATEAIPEPELEKPMRWRALDPSKKQYHIPSLTSARWVQSLSALIRAHEQLEQLSSRQSAHVAIWESAFAFLYHQEMEIIQTRPSIAPRRPEEYAMTMARRKVGQPKPLANQRFRVEAIWAMVEIRHRMAEIASKWLNDWATKTGSARGTLQKTAWFRYVSYLHSSCVRDSELSLRIADTNDSHKQALRCSALILHSRMRMFKFDFQIRREAGLLADDRKALLGNVEKELTRLDEISSKDAPERRRKIDLSDAEYGRLFSDLASLTRKEWEKVEQCLRHDKLYAPVTDEEMKIIIRAMMGSEIGMGECCR